MTLRTRNKQAHQIFANSPQKTCTHSWHELSWSKKKNNAGTPEPIIFIDLNVNLCRALRWPHLPISRRPAPGAVTARHRRLHNATACLAASHMEESRMAALNSTRPGTRPGHDLNTTGPRRRQPGGCGASPRPHASDLCPL